MTTYNVDRIGKYWLTYHRIDDYGGWYEIHEMWLADHIPLGSVACHPAPDLVDRPWRAFRVVGDKDGAATYNERYTPLGKVVVGRKPYRGKYPTMYEAKLGLILSVKFFIDRGYLKADLDSIPRGKAIGGHEEYATVSSAVPPSSTNT